MHQKLVEIPTMRITQLILFRRQLNLTMVVILKLLPSDINLYIRLW